ncbi:MAG: tRNA pseudouridine(38-40) synthase TruA [Clostridia bacterium]
MNRYKLTISYDGTAYFGFQRQPNVNTIQEVLEGVLSRKFGEEINLIASGRTDTGVHAFGQVAHFDTEKVVDCDRLPFELDKLLPADIAVTEIEKVDLDFHARFGAKSKTYLYRVYLSKHNAPLYRNYTSVCYYMLDVEQMEKACQYFVGEHDFRSFMSADESIKNSVREIYELRMERSADGKELDFFVSGNGFLRNMVRVIVGTIVDVGRGRFSLDDLPKIFAAKDRTQAGKTLEGKGLYLVKVEY